MPWTSDEQKQIARLEARIIAVEQHLKEIQSSSDRQLDERRHEWFTMLEAAKRVLVSAFEGKLDPLKGLLEYRAILDGMNAELTAAREERIARKVKEDIEDAAKSARKSTMTYRLKIAALLSPLVVAVVTALVAALVSHR